MLTTTEARVLGCLIEKEATTPDVYPLTLKALTTACNQTSNRDPVMSLSEHLVESAALALKAVGFARVVYPGSGERATKYRHVAKDALGVDGPEQAVLAVLLLRGPQTVAELRTRTERLHAFGSGELESTLDGLATREPPVVERIAGAREPRWRQLVAEEATPVPDAAADADADRPAAPPRSDRVADLEARVADLEARLARLEESLGA
ncbi:MAG TPA: YceH family protein [Acidimicrobiales bacterium]